MSTNIRIDVTVCAECLYPAPIGQIHTWLFCELHKAGHSRETIIANVLYTADALREAPDE